MVQDVVDDVDQVKFGGELGVLLRHVGKGLRNVVGVLHPCHDPVLGTLAMAAATREQREGGEVGSEGNQRVSAT